MNRLKSYRVEMQLVDEKFGRSGSESSKIENTKESELIEKTLIQLALTKKYSKALKHAE
ncbi:MAG: hypothetical protein SGI74_08040 [Oligoflexia bacterium]|nr:hypothetical protein [Oligoflexia bacterium]